MSVQVMSWVFQQSETRGEERLVLLAIANHASTEDGQAWPGMAAIAREANVHPDTAKRIVRRLHQSGHITRTANGATTRRTTPGRQPNHYVVVMDHDTIRALRTARIGGTENPPIGPAIEGTERPPNAPEDWGDGESPLSPELGGFSVGNWGDAASVIGGTEDPPESLENHQENHQVRAASRARSLEGDFEEFWSTYPRKLARAAALKAYLAKRRAGTSAGDLLVARERFAEHCRKTARPIDKTPYGASWLNNGWEDWLPGGAAETEAKAQASPIAAARARLAAREGAQR